MSSHYVDTASVNHIISTCADRLSRHPASTNHHCYTLPQRDAEAIATAATGLYADYIKIFLAR